jgi:hypothetical protein
MFSLLSVLWLFYTTFYLFIFASYEVMEVCYPLFFFHVFTIRTHILWGSVHNGVAYFSTGFVKITERPLISTVMKPKVSSNRLSRLSYPANRALLELLLGSDWVLVLLTLSSQRWVIRVLFSVLVGSLTRCCWFIQVVILSRSTRRVAL